MSIRIDTPNAKTLRYSTLEPIKKTMYVHNDDVIRLDLTQVCVAAEALENETPVHFKHPHLHTAHTKHNVLNNNYSQHKHTHAHSNTHNCIHTFETKMRKQLLTFFGWTSVLRDKTSLRCWTDVSLTKGTVIWDKTKHRTCQIQIILMRQSWHKPQKIKSSDRK
jgi:hypothetical protein